MTRFIFHSLTSTCTALVDPKVVFPNYSVLYENPHALLQLSVKATMIELKDATCGRFGVAVTTVLVNG